MQHVYSTHVKDLHKTIHVTCKACMVTQLVLCDLSIEYWGVILNPMYKKASLSDVQPATVYEHLLGLSTENYCNHIPLYEPKSHALMEYNGGLENAIRRDSELLSEVNDAFCKSHPLLAQKVVTRSAPAAVIKIGADALVSKALSVRRAKAGSLLKTIREVSALKLEENDILVGQGIILLALNLTFLLICTLTQNNLGPFQ